MLAAPTAALAAPPDPLERGPYATAHEFQYKVGTVKLQEPNSSGSAPTGAAIPVDLQVRGSMYYPTNRPTGAPVIVLVHGNHGGCQQGSSGITVGQPGYVAAGGSAPNCTIFNRNDQGYSYLAQNLATWGYAVASVDQDQMMSYQDSSGAKGMHQRRLLIAATLDGLYEANAGAVTDDANHNLASKLVGKLDFTRVGLMGHSRGGDAVTSFMDYNRTRPEPGRRYNLTGVISLAPVDYERRAPYGSAYLSILPACDGDVSNLQGARFYERGQRVVPGDPFPKIQMYLQGANHGMFNSVWSADSDDAYSGNDPACGANRTVATNDTSIRLSGGVDPTGVVSAAQKTNSVLATYNRATAFSPDQALMGDQERLGLVTMNAFFRRYVGGEIAFDPYMTGELTAQAGNNNVLPTACPTSPTGTRISCNEYLLTSYFPGAGERLDVIDPAPDTALTESALGTSLVSEGFANPYTPDGGISPKPATTASGLDWCNPEPDQFTPQLLGQPGVPTAAKGCPLPNPNGLGGQANSRREQAPVNESYGNQLAVAWDSPATLSTRVPASKGDVSGMKALALGAAVNFFDSRNPDRGTEGLWNPEATTQDFAITLTDAAGASASVHAGSEAYGSALNQTIGNTSARVHIVLSQVRVPLADFTGVDLKKIRKVSFEFGGTGYPATGSIQLADVRFQELTSGPAVLGPRAAAKEVSSIIDAAPRSLGADTGAAPKLAACVDTAKPTVKLAKKAAKAGTVTLSGSSADTGCGGAVAQVQLTLAKKVGGKYRYVTASGKLSKLLSKSKPVVLAAKGTTSWSLKLGKVPAGSYAVAISAIDAAGNVTTKTAGSLKVK